MRNTILLLCLIGGLVWLGVRQHRLSQRVEDLAGTLQGLEREVQP